MTRPVTQHAVARAAGVSRSTVTRALRDSPQISAAERKRIHAVARKLGYRYNPLVSALMTQLRTGRPATFHGALAYVVLGWDQAAWTNDAEQQAILAGARARAAELGYQIEVHHHEPARITARRLSNLIAARGIHGLLLSAPSHHGFELPPMHWARFSTVTLGFRLGSPPLHFTACDLFAAMWSLLQELRTRGYSRPGLVLDTSLDSLTSFRIEGALAVFQHRHLAAPDRLPPLLGDQLDQPTFATWLRTHRPDVVVTNTSQADAWLRSAGLVPPHPVGHATLRAGCSPLFGTSGVNRLPDLIGASGVDVVTTLINRSESGIPTLQTGTLIEPAWFEGATLRPRPA